LDPPSCPVVVQQILYFFDQVFVTLNEFVQRYEHLIKKRRYGGLDRVDVFVKCN
jgi:hypothetical protein